MQYLKIQLSDFCDKSFLLQNKNDGNNFFLLKNNRNHHRKVFLDAGKKTMLFNFSEDQHLNFLKLLNLKTASSQADICFKLTIKRLDEEK